MAISYTNNWKNILDKLEGILRDEFKGAMPVYTGANASVGNQFIRLIPTGSELLEYGSSSETRDFSIQILLYFLEANVKDKALDHILRTISRVEALIHDNMIITLDDATRAHSCRMQSVELNIDEENDTPVATWEFRCIHVGNIT